MLSLKDKVLLQISKDCQRGFIDYNGISNIDKITNSEERRSNILDELFNEGLIKINSNWERFENKNYITPKGEMRIKYVSKPFYKRFFISLWKIFKTYWQFIIGTILIGGIFPFLRK